MSDEHIQAELERRKKVIDDSYVHSTYEDYKSHIKNDTGAAILASTDILLTGLTGSINALTAEVKALREELKASREESAKAETKED